jgi:hypothetical protein
LRNPVENSPLVNIEDFVMILRQLIDKEHLIPYPLVGNWNEKITKWEISSKKVNVFELFKNFITLELINKWTRFDKGAANELLKPISDLLGLSEDFVLNIFSLNYDLVFENTLNSPEYKSVNNGFSEKSDKKSKFWSADFDPNLSPAKIHLYKLHGSLDWEYSQETEEVSIKDNVNDGREPLIIFGSSSKMLSFDPFLFILSKFRETLQNSTLFVVIGYSFHDKYINNLLIQRVGQNTIDGDKPKKILIIDPGEKRSKQSSSDFADELRVIQESKSINDVINFKQINPNRINLIPLTASQFYKEYFANEAEKLIKEVEQIEKGDDIFQ